MNDLDPHVPQAWRQRANCVGKTDLFFGEVASTGSQYMYLEAKKLCDACPVLDECREWALTETPHYGFVAGMSPRQRDLERRKRRRAA